MQDRQYFSKTELSNGMTLWHHQMDVPFTHIRIVVPVGAVHAHGMNKGGAAGIAHLLEHLLFEQDKRSPDGHLLEERVLSVGGDWNAHTYAFRTEYILEVPTEDAEELIVDLVDHIFNPTFSETALNKTIEVIKNELALRKYYPGTDAVSHYCLTQWMQALPNTKEQMFGSSESLAEIGIADLEAFHTYYASSGVHILVGGSADVAQIQHVFEKIKTHDVQAEADTQPAAWKQRAYHTRTFSELETPLYVWGGITPNSDTKTLIGFRFLTNFLADGVLSVLGHWLRKEKGWSYEIDGETWFDRDRTGYSISIPLNERSHAEHVHAEIHERVQRAIDDPQLIEQHAHRTKKAELFSFQTLEERMDVAAEELSAFGDILTESVYSSLVEDWAAPGRLRELYEQHFSPEVSEALLALLNKQDGPV